MSYEAPSLIRPSLTQTHSANYASHQKKLHFIDLVLSFENVCVGIWYVGAINLVQNHAFNNVFNPLGFSSSGILPLIYHLCLYVN